MDAVLAAAVMVPMRLLLLIVLVLSFGLEVAFAVPGTELLMLGLASGLPLAIPPSFPLLGPPALVPMKVAAGDVALVVSALAV